MTLWQFTCMTNPTPQAIFYFLDTTTFSALHRVKGDMIYHFYSGYPVQMLLLHPTSPGLRNETCIFGNNSHALNTNANERSKRISR